jgi:hypothetical protein
MNTYLGQVQNLDWASPSRIFATTAELFDSVPNYEHEVAITRDTGIKYQGVSPVVGGWAFATGEPIVPPAVTPAVNDSFTKALVEFNGLEGSRTNPDSNASNWPRNWTVYQGLSGFGGITNIGELFYNGALRLDGRTVLTAPDEHRFDFGNEDFTIRGWFFNDFPIGSERVLIAKTDQRPDMKFVYWAKSLVDGRFNVGIGTVIVLDHFLLDRFEEQIFDRQDEIIIDRFEATGGQGSFSLSSTTLYSSTVNPGWHRFEFTRTGSLLELAVDGVVESAGDCGVEVVNLFPGPFTIGGYGPPLDAVFQGTPWVGKLDRFAIDIGIAR